MEGPLLSKSEHITINGDSSTNAEHIVDVAANDDFSTIMQMPYMIATAVNSIEFVMTLVQIIVAIVIVTGAKGDHPEATWIIVYTCACIANLPILCWGFFRYQSAISEIGINSVMIILKMVLDYFFVGWSIVFLWFFVSNSSSLDHTSPLFWLSVVFIAFSFIRYVLPSLICAAMCCCMSVTLCIGGLWGFITLIGQQICG
uniref:E3 ubiquitin-protein ligase n=1 Tax=Noccaea caerulescens TaxID=107243 RepID=A0A1J3H2B3_NOCCA